jgi:hypothetical protein
LFNGSVKEEASCVMTGLYLLVDREDEKEGAA